METTRTKKYSGNILRIRRIKYSFTDFLFSDISRIKMLEIKYDDKTKKPVTPKLPK